MSTRLLQTTGRGFAFTFTSNVLVMAASLTAQLALAWLLAKHDFGVYAIAIAFSDFVMVFRDGGVAQWLARLSREEFDRNRGNAFLLALGCSSLAGAVVCSLSFIVGHVYGQPQVTQVMLIIGSVLPFGAYAVVGGARLQVDLRFRALAGLRLSSGFLRYSLVILFAYRGWGALSFALPVVAVTFYQWAFHLFVTRLRVRKSSASLRGCYGVFQQSRWVLSGLYMTAMLREADYAVLGLFVPTDVLGVYYFALQLTMQPVQLFSESLRRVVLPVFVRLKSDTAKVARSLRYGGALVGMVAAPAMLLLGVTAEPLTELLWKGRWAAAVGPIRLLALAMPFQLLAMFVEALSLSRGRFRFWTGSVFVRGVGRVIAALVAALSAGGGNLTVIAGVMSTYIGVSGIAQAFALMKNMRVAIRPLASRFAPPVIAGLAVSAVIMVMVPTADAEPVVRALVLNAAAFLAGLVVAFAVFCRPSMWDLLEAIRNTLRN